MKARRAWNRSDLLKRRTFLNACWVARRNCKWGQLRTGWALWRRERRGIWLRVEVQKDMARQVTWEFYAWGEPV